MKNYSNALKLVILCLTLLITLVFGLHTKDFGRTHTPYVNSAGSLSFTKYSIATAKADLTRTSGIRDDAEKLSLDVSLYIAAMPEINNRFSIIFSIYDTQDNSQILLGQWKNYLVIMSGDDYSNQHDQPRITIPLDSVEGYVYPDELRVQITANETSTTVSINEQLMAQTTHYVVPLTQSASTVSLGNTLNRKHGWTGALAAFELDISYCRENDLTEVEKPCSMSYATTLQDVLNSPARELENPTAAWVLQPAYAALSTVWLSFDSLRYWNTRAFNKDLLINLLGFIPITLAIFAVAATRYRLLASAVLTITATFAISLLIESVQVFIPSRTSSIVDLSANSFAGILTTAACCVAMLWTGIGNKFRHKRRRKRKRRKMPMW